MYVCFLSIFLKRYYSTKYPSAPAVSPERLDEELRVIVLGHAGGRGGARNAARGLALLVQVAGGVGACRLSYSRVCC